MTKVKVLFGLATVAMAIGLWFAISAPADALQGEYSRIINIHVPTIWVAYVAFIVTSVGSLLWLWKKNQKWDRLAASSVEVGVLFTGIALATGMIWGNAVWGTPWDWGDARLTTTAVMFFVYLGYLALRSSIDDPVIRARRSAVLGAIAVIQVPLTYFAVNLFRTLHQTQSIRPDGSTMPDEMVTAMFINVIAFSVLYVALLVARIDVAKAEEQTAVSDSLAGDAVKPPRLSDIQDV
jgi:heme exporter protein C